MKNKTILFILMSFVALNAVSQVLILKATKTMDYRFDECSLLLIQGEKATIKITGKPQNTIDLKILMISKHTKQATALNDLKYIKFVTEKEGSQLILRNYYESANRKIESNLSVIYELIVPEQLAIKLTNLYGAVNLYNLSAKKSVDISFGRLEMQAIGGTTNLNLRYSNLVSQKITGKLSGTLSKSDVTITNCAASLDINMNYGTLNASLVNDCDNVRIAGTRTEIILQTPSTDYNLDLKNIYSNMEIFDKTTTKAYKQSSKSSTKSIFVSTSYCSIKIKLK